MRKNRINKIVWDNNSPSVYIDQPLNKKSLFGRYIRSRNNEKVVCADFPICIETLDIPDKHDQKIKLFENGHIMRVYYNFYEKQWSFATSNRSNAKYSTYNTNKNLRLKWNKKSFYTLFNVYNKKIDFSTLNKYKTHVYVLFTPKIFITSRVKKGGIEKIAMIDNKTLEIVDYTNKISRESNGNIYINKNGTSYFNRDMEYHLRMDIIGNNRNVHYILLQNIDNESEFKRLFPYWAKEYNDMISHLHKMSVSIMRYYRMIHMCDGDKKEKIVINYMKRNNIRFNRGMDLKKKVVAIRKRKKIFDIYSMAIHEYWIKNKTLLTDLDSFKIICKQPSYLIAFLWRNALI